MGDFAAEYMLRMCWSMLSVMNRNNLLRCFRQAYDESLKGQLFFLPFQFQPYHAELSNEIDTPNKILRNLSYYLRS